MNTPGATIEEVCVLISAQLDMLEDPTPFTSDQWDEFHGRAERISMLCREFDPVSREDQLSVDYARRRLRPLPQPQPAEDEDRECVDFAEAV